MDIALLDRPETQSKFELIPVIFANGEDDDTTGLIAAIRNQKVLYEESVYQPGEPISIYGKTLYCAKSIAIFGPFCEIGEEYLNDPAWICIRGAHPGRKIDIDSCHLDFGRGAK